MSGEWCSCLCPGDRLQELRHKVNLRSGFVAIRRAWYLKGHFIGADVDQTAHRPLLLLLYITVGLLKKNPLGINHHRTQETPAERLQDPVFSSSHFWQLSSIAHVLTLIVMSSASRLHTAQVTRYRVSSLFYYSGGLVGLLALTGKAVARFEKALISLSLLTEERRKPSRINRDDL